MTTHTIDEALAKFRLIKGAGSESGGEGCVTSLVSWLAGEPWSDHPRCAHRLLCDLVIRGNDHASTTEAEQVELLRAADAGGLLDTWWIPTTVVVAAIAAAPKDGTPFERALAVERFVVAWKVDKPPADLAGANLTGANLTRANLTRARGDIYTVLPEGWTVTNTGLIVVAALVAALNNLGAAK